MAGTIFGFAPNGGPLVLRQHVARLETDGRVDRTLNLNILGSFIFATAVEPGGKILIGGAFTEVLGVARNNMARLNTDGTLDTAFNPNADGVVNAIAVQPDGKILAGGEFLNIGGAARNRIARLEATTGAADLLFDPNANNSVHAIAVHADTKILVGGAFNQYRRTDPRLRRPAEFERRGGHRVQPGGEQYRA